MKINREQAKYIYDYCIELYGVVVYQSAKGLHSGLCFYSSYLKEPNLPLAAEKLVKTYLYSRLPIMRRVYLYLFPQEGWWHYSDSKVRMAFLRKTIKHLKRKYSL